MTHLINKLKAIKVIPVIKIDDAKDAKALGQALIQGGIPCAEVTFRTACAAEAIKEMSELEDLLLGAGTILTIEQAKAAISAGAKFIISPGFDKDIVNYCQSQNVAVFPGVATPSDIQAALKECLEVLKFFPAEANGGVKALKAISAPYAELQFIPTGGINPNNLQSYLDLPSVLACGGSWMVPSHLIAEQKFDEITELCQEAKGALS